MTTEKDKSQQPEEKNVQSRRTVLKALAGIPVLGLFTYELMGKRSFDRQNETRLIKELGLENLQAHRKISSDAKGNLLRVGIIGFGTRATQLANGLGFMHPADMENNRKSGRLNNWLAQFLTCMQKKGLPPQETKFRQVGQNHPGFPLNDIAPIRRCLPMIRLMR